MVREFYPIMPTVALARVICRSPAATYARAAALKLAKTDEYLAGPWACRLRRGGKVGASYRFPRGQVPWNKGSHYTAGGRSAETRFKPGTRRRTWRPVGSYRINADGYLDRKVSDTSYPPKDWVGVHRLVWIEAHGSIPSGHAVVFLPGRRTTDPARITIDALELVTRAELMRRNSVHTRLPPDLVRLVQLRAALVRKINAREGRKP